MAERVLVRALTGWMTEDKGALVLAGNRARLITEELKQRVRNSRAAVAARPAFSALGESLIAPPKGLDQYLAQLSTNEFAAQLLALGYSPAIADLTKLIAVQPYTEIGDPPSELRDIPSGNLQAIAALTLPLTESRSFPVQYEPTTNTWYLSTRDTSMSLISNWSGMVREGIPGFGFGVALRPSFFRTAQLGDRYLLTDGYHRALHLLQRGITAVPVLNRKISSPNQLGVTGEPFSSEVLFGSHPPLLKDYFDNSVATEAHFPHKRKIITIQATEMTVLDPD